MICRIRSAIIGLHVGKGELPGHIYKGDEVYKCRVGVAIWLTLFEWSGDPRDLLYHGYNLGQPLRHSLLHESDGRGEEAYLIGNWRH